ncbi:MAG: hypothetical protein H5T69_09565 [Chloroflexi bacterium]|nr:hypothetical protein [Chloroflexota bacterium]
MPRWKIRRLYKKDAQGLDDDLLEDVGDAPTHGQASIPGLAEAKAGEDQKGQNARR